MTPDLQHDWADLLDRSLVDLELRVRQQRALVRAVAGTATERPVCPLVDCERVTRLRAALSEAIGVLEQTRSRTGTTTRRSSATWGCCPTSAG